MVPIPAVINKDVTVTFTFNGTTVECQLLDPSRVRPFFPVGETLVTACAEEVVVPSDAQTNGSITGEVLADYAATGISTLLENAIGTVVDFTWVEEVTTADEASTHTVTWVGKCFVPAINREFTAKRYSRHDLNLEVTAETSWAVVTTP